MKKIIILMMAMVIFLSGCKNIDDQPTNNPSDSNSNSNSSSDYDSNDNSDFNSSNENDIGDNQENSSDDTQSDIFDQSEVNEGNLLVSVNDTITRPEAEVVRPKWNSADILNPQIIKMAGANVESKAMRDKVLSSKDQLKVQGTSYYVSPNGSDDNDGKTEKSSFKTINAALALAQPGDAVLLERGAIFRLYSGVTLSNDVSYGAYGTGPKPEIWGSPENYAQPKRWSPHNIKNVWKIEFPRSDVGIMVFNHGELAGDMKYYIRNLTKNGDYYFDDIQKVLYVYCDKGNPGVAYKDIEIGSRNILFRLRDGARNVTIDNISFKYTGTFAIRGSMGCNNITITNCEIGWIGGSLFEDGSNRYGNGIEFTAGCQDIFIENCWIYQIYDAGFTFQITLGGKEDEIYSTYKNIVFQNNILEYCSWPFEWWPSSGECVIEDISINNNIMRFSGYGWAQDTRSPSHIRGPWAEVAFNTKNFVIKGNIFDCSNGPVYAWPWATNTQMGHMVTGNTYYQRNTSSSTNKPIMNIGYGDSAIYASNQDEFYNAILTVDSNPKLVKWMD